MVQTNIQGQFEPTYETVKMFLKQWDISGSFMWAPIEKGLEHRSISISAPEQDYVLRVYRQDSITKEDIEKEVAFMNHLNRNKVPVPKVFVTEKEASFGTLTEAGIEWNAILMEKLPGQHIKTYTKETIIEIGKILALIHIVSMDSPGIKLCKYDQVIIEPLSQELDFDEETDPRSKAFLTKARDFKIEIAHDLPKGIVHRDITKGNTLFNGDTISGVLDFSSMRCGYFVEDIGVVMWGIIFNHITKKTPIELIKHFLTAYAAIRSLSRDEYLYLDKFVELRNYILGVENYIVDRNMRDELLVDAYIKYLG